MLSGSETLERLSSSLPIRSVSATVVGREGTVVVERGRFDAPPEVVAGALSFLPPQPSEKLSADRHKIPKIQRMLSPLENRFMNPAPAPDPTAGWCCCPPG